MLKKAVLASIRFYQRYLSFDHGLLRYLFLTDKACRFSPTCSEYTYQAVKRYGIIGGLRLGLRRILKCHPLSRGGDDPLPHKRI